MKTKHKLTYNFLFFLASVGSPSGPTNSGGGGGFFAPATFTIWESLLFGASCVAIGWCAYELCCDADIFNLIHNKQALADFKRRLAEEKEKDPTIEVLQPLSDHPRLDEVPVLFVPEKSAEIPDPIGLTNSPLLTNPYWPVSTEGWVLAILLIFIFLVGVFTILRFFFEIWQRSQKLSKKEKKL